MSAEPIDMHLGLVRARALQLGRRGFRVLRVHPNGKRPIGEGWTEHATDDISILDEIIVSACNIGVACGFQPGNGLNLVVIDVDLAGLEAWAQLVEINGIPETVMHLTPSGGLHIFFNAPPDSDFNNSPGRLPPGIDVRGRGGQVVVPPSRRTVDGELAYYAAIRKGLGLWEHDVADMPEWLVDLLTRATRAEVDRSVRHHPSNAGGTDNADWLRAQWDWVAKLEAIGYVVVKQVGDRIFLRHPTATSEWSCTVDPDGRMCAYSTNMPSPLRDAQYNSDGSVSWSPYDWFVATEHGGDYSAATRAVNGMRGYSPAGGGRPERTAETAPDQGTPLFLPAEWYDQRPWMQACRQMAHAVGGSPSAHLLAYITRWATLIPPGYTIPAINGAPSSFDLLSVIAGTSGSGKTSPMTNAEYLLPVMRKDLRMGLGIGSGEGMIEAFYTKDEFEGSDGKRKSEKRKTIAGVSFSISEGLIFADLADRGGTTHVTRLCDAWSGAALSTANASAETFRHIDRGQYRLTMMMGIQADMAHELMTDESASQGFVGRLLFAWAEEPRVTPRPRPPEPPILIVPAADKILATSEHPTLYNPVMLTYPDEVYTEIQAAADARVGTNVPVEEHHHDLLRCKVAGIVALMAGRSTVTTEDWSIATALVDTSAGVRKHLYAHRLQKARDIRHNQAEARADIETTVDDLKERKRIASMADNIRAHVKDESWARGALRKKVSYDDRPSRPGNRHLFERALALAVQNVWVKVVDGRIEKA